MAALSLAIAFATAGPAMSTGPRAKATPNKQLSNHTILIITGKGFSPHQAMFVVQCNRSVAKYGGEACSTRNYADVTTTRKALVPETPRPAKPTMQQ
jgi:hypothetical protein